MTHEICSPLYERCDERGSFVEVLNSGPWEALIRGSMNPDSVLGNHYHERTTIFFYLVKGSARIKTVHVETSVGDEFLLCCGQGVLLPTKESHAICFLEESEFVMLKSERYDPSDPDTFPFPV